MKRILVLASIFAALAYTGASFAQQPDNSVPATKTARAIPTAMPAGTKVNYVRTWSPNQPLTDPAAITAATDAGNAPMSTAYFDGLGRPLQTVVKGASPVTKKDLVTPVEYDAYGRTPFNYLPYVSTSGDGILKLAPFAEQKAFYDGQLTTANNTKEEIYYAETQFESSPLNRVLKSMPAGNNWTGSARGTSQQYLVNATTDEVRKWQVGTLMTGNVPYSVVASNGAYAAGELLKNVTTDEAGRQLVAYVDKEGHTILKKVQIAATPGANHTGWLCTYYIYDLMGNLRFVLPPKVVEGLPAAGWVLSAAASKSLCFRYEYDVRNRMVIKKVPGADSVEMVYDQRDRLVLTRDGNLRAVGGKWLATLYDNLNRPTMTGIYTSTRTHSELIGDQSTSPGANTILPASLDPLTYTYYDNYTYAGAKAAQSAYYTSPQAGSNPWPETIAASTQTRGLVTGTKIRVLETAQYLTTTTYYDAKNRPIQILSDNINAGVDVTTNLYDFAGKLLSTYEYYNNPAAGAAGVTRLLTNFSYDHAGRVLKVTKKLNDNTAYARDIATNTYDQLGQLQKKEFKNAAGTVIESMTYTYNIRGWLKGINRNYVKGTETRYFGQELHYDAGFTNKEYNGNIAGVTWKGTKTTTPNAYGYVYDAANRLLKANFTQSTGATTWGETAVNYDSWMGDGINYTSAYDANGNILRMQQWGAKGASTNAKIDSLAYTYYDSTGLFASNKLYKVVDGANDPATTLGDFSDQNAVSTFDYAYDRNGNLTKDENKKITSIQYNLLNLPKSITLTGKGTISYVYDATGRKLTKTVLDQTVTPNKTTRTDYLGPTIYENNVLQMITHEEGRIRPIAGGSFTFDYFMKDHLGNVRIVLAETNPPQQLYMASMEPEQAAAENALFSNIDASRTEKPVGYPDDPQTNQNTSVAKLNGNDPDRRIGPSLVLKVKTGDTVRLGARAFYKTQAFQKQQNPGAPATDMAAALIRAFGNPGSGARELHGADENANGTPFGNNFINDGWQRLVNRESKDQSNPERPKAYLNFVLFDEQFNLVEGSSGVKQVAAQPDELQTLAADNVVMEQSGFLYVYTSNETQQDVFFDNVTVVLAGTPVLEETHYYPFGLVMNGLSDKQAIGAENRMKYNGKELQTKEFTTGTGLEWYDYGARMYDQQLGRWHVIDALSEEYKSWSPYNYTLNNPLKFIDPDGNGVYGDYYKKDGTYLGNDGKNDNKVYVVENDGVISSTTKKGLTTRLIAKSKITDITTAEGINHEQFVQFAANVFNEASGMEQDEKNKVASAMLNRKSNVRYEDKDWTYMLDRIMFNNDTHAKKMEETDRKPGNKTKYGKNDFTNQDVSAEKYREYYSTSKFSRSTNTLMKEATSATATLLAAPSDLVNGANSWRGNGKTHKFFTVKKL
ncbi:DUF6443 domain-containing protein [Chitinophaga sp. NPDC101104]|uniref:DUF6443 domain-containing protein n=1 Tax=Chitinophaga sp. NPDC101104 TaxID=3390561 RepID=UPI003CFCAD14